MEVALSCSKNIRRLTSTENIEYDSRFNIYIYTKLEKAITEAVRGEAGPIMGGEAAKDGLARRLETPCLGDARWVLNPNKDPKIKSPFVRT